MNVDANNVKQVLGDLEQLVEELPVKDRKFADSLIMQGKKRALSGKQMYWLGRMLEIAVHGDVPIEKPSQQFTNLSGLMELFATAKKYLKYPKITLVYGDVTFRLSMAGQMSQKPGWVNITDGKSYGENQWFGRISPEGLWEQPHSIEAAMKKRLARLLQKFNDNVALAAATYGKLTGNCCFCNKPLGEGEDQTSVDWGYGSTCAKNYGLPWGKKKAAA